MKITVLLPPSIPEETWEAFVEMRKIIKAPLTNYGAKCILRALLKMQSEGHDPVAALERSIMLSYRGVFPVEADVRGGSPAQVGVGPLASAGFRCRDCKETFITHAQFCAHQCRAAVQ